MNKEFTLFELSRRLAHSIDMSNNAHLKREASDALLTGISANLQIFLDQKGTGIPAGCSMDQLLDKAVEQSKDLQHLCNVLHDLVVFQHNSDTFQTVLSFMSQVGLVGGGFF